MNRVIKEATVKRYHYDTHRQLKMHLNIFIAACNYARRLKMLRGLTPYESISRSLAEQPQNSIIKPESPITGTKHIAFRQMAASI